MADNVILSVEEVLPRIGEYGRYQKGLDLIFCLLNMPVAMQILIMTFATITPTWRCTGNGSICNWNGTFDGNDLTRCNISSSEWEYTEAKEFSIVTQFDIHCGKEWILQLLQSIFFVGWGIGAIVLGFVGDKYGRKFLMFPSFSIVLLVGFVISFLPNVYLIVFCRFIIGFCIHGTSTQAYILISEVVGNKQRPFACLIIFLFTSIAWCLLDLQAYLLKNWKILNIVSTVPYVFILFCYKIVPESIQWLQSHGKTDEVMLILSKIAKWNNKELPSNITISSPRKETRQQKSSHILDIFRTRKLAINSLQLGYLWVFIAMGYYGLYMATDVLGGSIYGDFIFLNLVDIPALFIAMYIIDRIGRKFSTIVPLLIGGITCTAIAFTRDLKVIKIVLGSIGKFFLCISFNGIYTWSVELYPTEVRSVGMGFTAVAGRVGSAAAPWITKGLQPVGNWLPFVVLGVPSVVGFFIAFSLPETKQNNAQVGNLDESGTPGINLGAEGVEEVTNKDNV